MARGDGAGDSGEADDDSVARLADADAAEIDGQHIEGRLGAAVDGGGHAADERIRAVGFHEVHEHALPAPWRLATPLNMRFLLALLLSVVAVRAADKPNIIIFLIDDLGATDLGCCGSKFYDTPNSGCCKGGRGGGTG